jgi:GMP synthase-like glutamine amidotransferase
VVTKGQAVTYDDVEGGAAPRVLVVQLGDSAPPGRLGQWLAEHGLHLDVHRPAAGDELPSLDGYRALILLGGPVYAGEGEAPAAAATQALLRTAVSEQVPTLAIGRGAALLALAHGGRVGPSPEGPQLGAALIAKRANASIDPLFRSMPITPDVIQWHDDAITALPPGAVQLASAPSCENQAFRLGRLAWGLAFHIETTPEVVRRWASTDTQRRADHDLDRIAELAVPVHEDIAEVWRPFAGAFAQVARDPDSVRATHPIRSRTAAPVTDPAAIRAALAAEAQAAHRGSDG